jgi:hypothetical protein
MLANILQECVPGITRINNVCLNNCSPGALLPLFLPHRQRASRHF